MGGGEDDRAAAAADLRRRLEDGLARSRRSKAQLAGLVGLSRTTVHEAFRSGAVPSAETTAALARGLGLDEAEMLDLRRRACGSPPRPCADGMQDDGVGLPIEASNPHDLEVHPAAAMPSAGVSGRDSWVLPGYVERGHDRVLTEAVRGAAAGRSAMVVLVGSSSTGKTRACWEAVQPLAGHGWQLWHPFDPTRAEAALADLGQVGPRTVVWLNEAQSTTSATPASENRSPPQRTRC